VTIGAMDQASCEAAFVIRSASVFSPGVGPLLPDQSYGVSQDPPGGDIPDRYFCLMLDEKEVAV